MNQRKFILLILIVFLVATVFVAVFITRKDSPAGLSERPIGVVLSLTGRGGTYGQRALNGMQLAVDKVNLQEPFLSNPISLRVEDSQSSSQQALSAFRKLIDIDHVSVVIGFVLSDEVLTCAPVANERGIVILTTAAGSDKIKDAGDYVFRNRESGNLQAEEIARACVEDFGFSEIAIMHSNAANGISYRNAFQSALEELNGTVPLTVGYNEGKTDYRAEIEQIRAKSPRAVYLAGLDQELGLILKQSYEVGFAPKFYSSAGAISDKLLEIAGVGAEGLVCGSAPFNVESENPQVREFTAAFRTQFGVAPDFIAANSYDAVNIIAEIFKSGSTDAESIKNGLYATVDFPGIGGNTTFDSYGEVTKPIVLVVVKDGRFVPLEKLPQ